MTIKGWMLFLLGITLLVASSTMADLLYVGALAGTGGLALRRMVAVEVKATIEATMQEKETWLSPEAYDKLMRDRQETLHELAKRDAEIERLREDNRRHNAAMMTTQIYMSLEEEIERLRALLSEARDALRYETEANYPDRNQLPSDMHGYEMDMDIVHRIEAALAAKENKP